ncbi:cytochrome b [Sphingobium sp. HBC34]|uniref:Cytochrome b n=1 Tax=Sphingobium cyanobacteriorum TaxID=3063954 RepID=A0ABT8ZM35_9SPHN|nr:cytochrome b [Sphingobium sp. HBC34]MDO7835531.1 cytochrome b [Sphingobium sp. HBC34]
MSDAPVGANRYPLSLRILHWIRAILILGLIALGFVMTSMPEDATITYEWFYPVHKEFGVLVFFIALVQLLIRSRSTLPALPPGLARWEVILSKTVHHAMLVLIVVVPLMGYSMSSSFTQSDGVPFFFMEMPELLPKNDKAFAIFDALHTYLAYTLLGLIVLHVAGVVKHRFLDKGGDTDVLPRML